MFDAFVDAVIDVVFHDVLTAFVHCGSDCIHLGQNVLARYIHVDHLYPTDYFP